jgi:hypothetical protein
VAWLLTPLGVAAAVVFLAGQVLMEEADLDFDADTARRAEALVPPWPQPAQLRGRIATFDARVSGNDATLLAEASRHHEEAVRRDDRDPFALEALGDCLRRGVAASRPGEAHLRRRAPAEPVSVSLRNALGDLALARGREADVASLVHRIDTHRARAAQDRPLLTQLP